MVEMSDFLDTPPENDPKKVPNSTPHVTPPSSIYRRRLHDDSDGLPEGGNPPDAATPPKGNPPDENPDAANPPDGNPPENPDIPGKILYDYSHDLKKEAELIRVEEKEKVLKRGKRKKINIEVSHDSEKTKYRDPNEKDAVDKMFHGIFSAFDSLFSFFGLGKDEKSESTKKGKRKDDIEMEK